jgi:hypothetical protein
MDMGLKFPGIKRGDFIKYQPSSAAEAKGHLRGTRYHKLRPHLKFLPPDPEGSEGDSQAPTEGEDEILAFKFDLKEEVSKPDLSADETHGDLTGPFPIRSRDGNKYLLVMFSTGGNFIHIEPIKDREGPNIAKAYSKGIEFFREKGINTSIERIDNEISLAFKRMCKDKDVKIEYVPPGQHRANIAERMIAVVKSYLISALATSSPFFPIDLWDLLLPQVEITINLLRPSRVDPRISAYEALHGKFNFNKTPLAPPGSECIILERPNERATWPTHGPSLRLLFRPSDAAQQMFSRTRQLHPV